MTMMINDGDEQWNEVATDGAWLFNLWKNYESLCQTAVFAL